MKCAIKNTGEKYRRNVMLISMYRAVKHRFSSVGYYLTEESILGMAMIW
jgi:hypothetical protein